MDVDQLLEQARQALRQRQAHRVPLVLQPLLTAQPQCVEAWMLLAMAARVQGDAAAELRALHGALTANPYDLLALLIKGQVLERLQRPEDALQAQRAACQVASETDTEALGLDLQRMLRHAQARVRAHQDRLADALDSLVRERCAGLPSESRDRFEHAVELLLGRRQRFDPQPMGFYYPQLAPREFFRREYFPWAERLESRTEVIREEFLRVLAEDSDFEPYLQYGSDQPLAQWAELNRNPRWSAFHLLKDGLPVVANAARCPRTMAALAPLPQPYQQGRTPVAMFSLLKPGTRIPPHVGISNVRLVAHLPLIVPPRCGLRVGSQTHHWRPGELCVFDDTIEHEAWNDSEELRVVLIFDVWHPDLSLEERSLIQALIRVQDEMGATLDASP